MLASTVLLVGDNCCVFVISKESELHHSIGSLIDGAHPGPKTDRDYLGQYCLKTFLSFPLPFQRSSDSTGPDSLYRSSDLGEPHLSGSLCCDEAQILLKSTIVFFWCRQHLEDRFRGTCVEQCRPQQTREH